MGTGRRRAPGHGAGQACLSTERREAGRSVGARAHPQGRRSAGSVAAVQEEGRVGAAAVGVRRRHGAARQRDRQAARTVGRTRSSRRQRRRSPARRRAGDPRGARRRRQGDLARPFVASTRHAVEDRADRQRLALRDQVRRLSRDVPHRQGQGAADHAGRPRLDGADGLAGGGDRSDGCRLGVARRRDRRDEQGRRSGFQRPAERLRLVADRADPVLPVRRAVLRRLRPAQGTAAGSPPPAAPARRAAEAATASASAQTSPARSPACSTTSAGSSSKA